MMSSHSESTLMRTLSAAGLESWAWRARRLHCPVAPDALVLEVGSGGNPYPRSNILVDAYPSTRERHWAPLRVDRPTVLAYGERLPFKDKAFDFVIACHVLEHSPDPDLFLAELQRVGKAGYIETPDAFMERINPYRDHRLEVTVRDGELAIRKKSSWRHSEEVVELYEHMAKPHVAKGLIPRHPAAFHARYHWKDEIRWKVLNPSTRADWPAPGGAGHESAASSLVRDFLLDGLQWVFAQRLRNQRLDIVSLLRCPACLRGSLTRDESAFGCGECGRRFGEMGGIPDFKVKQ